MKTGRRTVRGYATPFLCKTDGVVCSSGPQRDLRRSVGPSLLRSPAATMRSGRRFSICSGLIARDAAHLLGDVVAALARREGQKLVFHIGCRLALLLWAANLVVRAAVAGPAGRDAS